MGIQRWGKDGVDYWMSEADAGRYVLFSDHEQVVAEMQAHFDECRSVGNDMIEQHEAEITSLRAELAAKSKDAARWDWIMNNYYGGDLTRTQKVIGACFSREAMEAAIDKDLGE